ncbi:hypothetical protein ANO11243_085150 [Dothideomycetidae sp. 11243]|nr:hypothetical protein ANO11243_085150 [fungal sp. No.11243]
MVAPKLVLLAASLFAASALAGKMKLVAHYIDGQHSVTRDETVPSNKLAEIATNINTWSDGKYSGSTYSDTVWVHTLHPAKDKNKAKELLEDMKAIVDQHMSSP